MNQIRTPIAEFTRPANVTAYAAGQSVSDSTASPTVRTFPNAVASVGGFGQILGAIAHKSTGATTNATFRLHLYNATVTATNDGSALPINYSDRAKYIGHIALTFKAAGSGAAFAVSSVSDTTNNQRMPLLFNAASGDVSIYGVLEATGAYAPGNAETFSIQLLIETPVYRS